MTTDTVTRRLKELTDQLAHTHSSEKQRQLAEEIQVLTSQLVEAGGVHLPSYTIGSAEVPERRAAADLRMSPFTLGSSRDRGDRAATLIQLAELHEKGLLDDASYGKAVRLLVESLP